VAYVAQLPCRLRPQPAPRRGQGGSGGARLGAVEHDLVAVGADVGQIDPRKLVVRLALVHLLLDAAAAFTA